MVNLITYAPSASLPPLSYIYTHPPGLNQPNQFEADMEVALPPRISSPEFNFSSAYASPHISAPTSPKRFGDHYFSAPSSPTRASAFYQDFNDYMMGNRNGSIPYDWEEKPGTPKSKTPKEEEDDEESRNGFEFAFDFSRDSDSASSVAAADELFDGGKIKLLKPPPRLQIGSRLSNQPLSSPKSPRSPIARIRQALSPRERKDVDPFAVAMEQSRKSPVVPEQRGRERGVYSSSNASRKGSRSLSPYRTSGIHYQEAPPLKNTSKPTSSIPKPPSSSASSSASSSRRWSFRDFLLFRSASEGRASDRDPLRKFSLHSSKHRNEDVKNSSFRSVESSGSMSRRGRVSAHELHYKSNRAVAEEMKRKTVLPYKQGLFGWFRI